MAQNLSINSVAYNGVTSLSIPKSGGGTAVFPDTSDANATKSDVASGKTAYVNGSKITGTATGGDSNDYPDPIVAGNTPVFASAIKTFMTNSTTVQVTGMSITMSRDGTYRFGWSLHTQNTSGQARSQIYLNGVAQGTETSHTSTTPAEYSLDLACEEGDVVELRLRSSSTLYRVCAGGLIASIDWDPSALHPEGIEAGDTLMLVSERKTYLIGSTTLTASGMTITIPAYGTYRLGYSAVSQTAGQAARARIYRNGTAEGTESSNSTTTPESYAVDLECEEGDVLELLVRSGGSTQWASFGGLTASIAWQIGPNPNLRDVSVVNATAGDVRQGKKIVSLDGVITGTMVPGGVPSTIIAGDTPVLYAANNYKRATSTSALTATGISITVPYDGTYRFKWQTYGEDSIYKSYSQLYQNATAVGTRITATTATSSSLDLACTAGDVVQIYLRGYNHRGTFGDCGGLVACIDWDNGF